MSISKFETMLKTDSIYFFDGTEFEEIVQHYLNIGKHSLAHKALQLGVEQHPSSTALKLLQVELLIFENKLLQAVNLLNQVASIEPNNGEVYIQKAMIFSKKGQHREAISVLKKSLEFVEDMLDVWSLLGMEYLYLDDFDNARSNFAKCIDVDFEDYSSLYNIIYCFEMKDQFEDAIVFLNSYLDKNPYSEVAWHQLGRQYYTLSMYKEALASFDYAVLIDDAFIGGYVEKAKTLEKLERYNEAIENYLVTLELDDPTAFAYTRIGECFEQLNDTDKAIEYYNKAVHEDPSLDSAWVLLTDVFYKRGEFNEALYHLEKALQIDDGNTVYWRKFANVNIKLGIYKNAIKGYEKCIELGDLEIEIYIALSDVLSLLGSYEESLNILISAKRIYKEFAEIEYRLCGLFMKLHNDSFALIHLKNGLAIDFDYRKIVQELFPLVYDRVEVQRVIKNYQKTMS